MSKRKAKMRFTRNRIVPEEEEYEFTYNTNNITLEQITQEWRETGYLGGAFMIRHGIDLLHSDESRHDENYADEEGIIEEDEEVIDPSTKKIPWL